MKLLFLVEEHQKRQQHLPSQADIKITRLNTNINFQKEYYNKTINYKKSNPTDSKRETEKNTQIHNYTLKNAGKANLKFGPRPSKDDGAQVTNPCSRS